MYIFRYKIENKLNNTRKILPGKINIIEIR